MSEHDDRARDEILALEAAIHSDPSARHEVEHLLAPEFWEVTASGEKVSRGALLDRLANSPLIVDAYPVDDTRVDVYGDVAVSTGRAALRGRLQVAGGEEQAVVRTSRYVRVWVRTDGVWHTVYAQSSPSPEQ